MDKLEFQMVQPNGQIFTFTPDEDKYSNECKTYAILDDLKQELLELFESLYVAKANPYILKKIMDTNTILCQLQERITDKLWSLEFKALTTIQSFQLN